MHGPQNDIHVSLAGRWLVILSIMLLSPCVLTAQETPQHLRTASLQKEIISLSSQYDSLMLFDKSSYWADDDSLKGFGFRNGHCYLLTLHLQKTSSGGIQAEQLRESQDEMTGSVATYIKTNFHELKNLHNDSLNLRSRSTTIIEVSDADMYSLLVVYPQKQSATCLYSYAPLSYQQTVPTIDRHKLLVAFRIVNKLIH